METKKLKYYTVFLDGIDKCGKDTIRQYIWQMDKRLNVFCRGWPSLYAYSKKFNRNTEYKLPWENAVYVKLDVNEDDWHIRCTITSEPEISFNNDMKLFNEAFDILKNEKYKVLEYNTTNDTAYNIALDIVVQLKCLNGEY